MPEDKTPEVQETASESTPKETPQSSPNDELIAESKKYRKRAQDAEARIKEYEENSKKAKETKMIEEGKKDEVIANLIAERDQYKTSHDQKVEYEQRKISEMLEKYPEEDKAQLSKLDFETLEYVTNKIHNVKANAPEVAGNPRQEFKTNTKWHDMDADERRDNWGAIIKSYNERKV
tara:strand:+ start:82 stop:612 length:531 start_codon:yes stop_codon:yes gene_type:complete